MMKAVLKAVVCGLVLAPSLSLACMPPDPNMPQFVMQQRWLSKVISEPAVEDEMAKHPPSTRIESIDLKHGVLIKLSNKCEFTVVTDDSNAGVGTCPILLPMKVGERRGCAPTP